MRIGEVERGRLVDTLRELGPDRPTLCEGWTTRDLTAHLLVRERRPDAAAGIAVSALASRTERIQKQVADADWESLLAKLSTPPVFSPYRIGALDDAVNTVEFAVHREDARRGEPGWQPEETDPALDARLWRSLKLGRPAMLRKAPGSVALVAGEGRRTGPADAELTVTGKPLELMLFCFGRQGAADVSISGDPAKVEALRTASLGL